MKGIPLWEPAARVGIARAINLNGTPGQRAEVILRVAVVGSEAKGLSRLVRQRRR